MDSVVQEAQHPRRAQANPFHQWVPTTTPATRAWSCQSYFLANRLCRVYARKRWDIWWTMTAASAGGQYDENNGQA